jgi:hypothetical protein
MSSNDETLSIRWTEPHEQDMFCYSHSKVEAVLTCPVWGIVRYVHNLYYPNAKRAMALEAGSAMHEVFAACRLWQVYRLQHLEQHFRFHAERLYGKERFAKAWEEFSDDPRHELINFCFNILNSGDFYDDPDDNMRTTANMETTIIRYVDERMKQFEANPIWIEDENDPTKRIGIEQVFDVIITYRGISLRYIGTIDGIITPKRLFDNGTIVEAVIDENKTASRLDETWRKSYMVKSQPTGYIAVARLITSLVVTSVRMIGVKVKQTRSSEDIQAFIEEREDWQLLKWVQSLHHAHSIVEQYKDMPLDAPQYTHSCSRYFRPCAFIELCAAHPTDQETILASMVPGELSPSELAVREQTTAQ